MKIAVISSTVFALPIPHYGGLEVVAWECAKGLAERGHSVTLIAPDGSTCPGCDVIHFGPAGKIDEHSAFQQYWKRLFDFDCIISHDWQKWAYTLKEEGCLKCPVLGVTHAPVNTMFGALPNVERPCFVCISKDQADHFEAIFGRPARYVHNGVDTDFYSPLSISRSNRSLFLARFSSIKGPDLAISACQRAGVGLDMIGDTTITGEPELYQRCMAAADGKQIRVIGGIPRGETVWWYSQANVMLHPNQRFREPLGLAPLEAQACGCPVIAWRYGAMKETVKHGETGWLVSSLDEMVDIIKTATINDDMRKRCREWVCDNFSIRQMVTGYDRLCEEAVNGGW